MINFLKSIAKWFLFAAPVFLWFCVLIQYISPWLLKHGSSSAFDFNITLWAVSIFLSFYLYLALKNPPSAPR